jgi:alkanesulfonate monooxygenase SsuD/methylene tetrahydromethanopterin reductase-like flavin-dependent oxidoreductase (luciferase family)
MAIATHRLRLGPMVTPVPRYRPEQLARQAVSLDHLSGGRLILGVGLGDDSMREYSAFGNAADAGLLAEMLDEGLAVLTGLWRGERFSFEGKHYQVDDAQFLPPPLQTPRIPIWVAGRWPSPRPFRRAARWDGVVPAGGGGALSPEECRQLVQYVAQFRRDGQPLDVAINSWDGTYDLETEPERVRQFESAGATWYQVGFSEEHTIVQALDRIRLGPPAQDR